MGETLRRARERQGLSVQQVCDAIHINPQYLTALEEEDLKAFAADVYARGFLRSYASFLGLDPAPLLEEFASLRTPPAVEPPTGRRRAGRASRSAAETAVRTGEPTAYRPRPLDQDLFAYSRRAVRPERRKGSWLPVILLAVLAAAAFVIWRSGIIHRLAARFHHTPTATAAPALPVHHAKPAPVSHPIPPNPNAPLTLQLRSVGWVYLKVTVDTGKDRTYEGEWYPGLRKTWTARKRIDLYADRGNNIIAVLNGNELGKLANRRQRVWRMFAAPSTNPAPGSGNSGGTIPAGTTAAGTTAAGTTAAGIAIGSSPAGRAGVGPSGKPGGPTIGQPATSSVSPVGTTAGMVH